MTWKFGDGFDHYDSAVMQAGAKWQISATPTIHATNGRRGGGCLILDSGTEGLLRSFGGSAAALVAGVGVYLVSNVGGTGGIALISFRDAAGAQVTLGVAPTTNELVVYRGTINGGTLIYSTGVNLGTGSYSYVEFKALVDASAGTVEVRVNGVVAGAAQTGLNTRAQGATVTAFAMGVYAHNQGAVTLNIRIDDLYVCDTAGSINNDFLGDVRADLMLPNAAGNYQDFTCSTGSDHDALVDENPPNTSDYNSSSTNTHKETYGLTDLSGLAGIKCVQVNNYVLKGDAGLALIKNKIRSSSTDQDGATFGVSTSPLYSTSVHETDPATSAAWTLSGVNAMEAGCENVTT